MKKILLSLLLILSVFCFPIVSYATDSANNNGESTEEPIEYPRTTEYPNEPDRCPLPAGEHVIVMDASTGQILYEKDIYAKAYPASITKIMTSLLALENGDLNSIVTMSEDAVWGIERDSSHIALDVDEQITLEQALYAVLLKSANEAAWAVAEHISGSLSSFCDLMNQKATELGCVNTHFVNANGLHDDNHYTCAYDMALITKEVIKNQTFLDITSQTYYNIPPTNKIEEERNLWQDNKMIKPDSDFYYEYCLGGKTGFTDQALGTLVTWARKDDKTLICVTMRCKPSINGYTDSKALYEYYFNNFSYQKPLANFSFSNEDLIVAEDCLNNYYNGTNGGTLSLSVDTDVTLLMKNTDDLSFTSNFHIENSDSDSIGELIISSGEEQLAKLPITYSGYILVPTTEEATEAEIATPINNLKENKTNDTYDNANDKNPASNVFAPVKKQADDEKSHVLIYIIVTILVLVSIWLFIHVRKIKKQRLLYKKKRDHARKQGRSIK